MSKQYGVAEPILAKLQEQATGKYDHASGELTSQTSLIFNSVLIATGIVAIIVGLLGFFVGSGLSLPITRMTGAMKALAGGDNTVDVPTQDLKYEIGEMAKAVVTFKDNAIEQIRMAEQAKAEQEAKQKRVALIESRTKEFESAVASSLESVGSAATQLTGSAESMSTTAEQASANYTL
jgi:methyl-accepting chemotaxis protein